MVKSYFQLIKTGPLLWRKAYFYAEKNPIFLLLDRVATLFSDKLFSLIKSYRCNFIISTHPFVTAFLSRVKRIKKLKQPFYTIITDFVLHPAYVRNEIDGYFTASPHIETFAEKHKVSAEQFYHTGIPIIKDDVISLSKTYARFQLGLDQTDKNILLIAGGGLGYANYVNIIRSLDNLEKPVEIICMMGHNKKAEEKILRLRSKHSIKVVGFTQEFLIYLRASDCILSKAGGLTMAESLACETPIIIYNPVPGHEEHNARYLAQEGAALFVKHSHELPANLEKVLYDQSFYDRLQKRAQLLKKPDAASEIVRKITLLYEDQQANG